MISKKFKGFALMLVLISSITTPTISFANSYSNVDANQVSANIDKSIINHYDGLGLDIQSNEIKDKIKDKKILIDNRNNKKIIEQSYIEPVVIYEESFIISGYEFNKNNNKFVEVDPISNQISNPISSSTDTISIPSLTATSLTWNPETKSSVAVVTYKGTYVTLNESISAQICYNAPGLGSNDKLIEFKNFNASWSTSNNLDAGDYYGYFNDYNGGYVDSYSYKFMQAGYPYNGVDGSFTCTGTDDFRFWQSSGGYTYTIAPRGYNKIVGNSGLLSGYAKFFVIFYGGTSSDQHTEFRFLNDGWGDLIIPE